MPSRIHHVGLPVSDLDRSAAWYRDALGLTPEPGLRIAFLADPDGTFAELISGDEEAPST